MGVGLERIDWASERWRQNNAQRLKWIRDQGKHCVDILRDTDVRQSGVDTRNRSPGRPIVGLDRAGTS